MGLTDDQKDLAMVIAGKIGGALSMFGSSFIIRDVYKRWRKKRHNGHLPTATYLVLSMSIGDVGTSFFAFVLGSWLVPKGQFPLASGNQATCEAQAFLFGIFFGSSNMTNGLMALTYWLSVCRGKSEAELRRGKWKALLFGFPWALGLTYSAAARSVIDPTDWPMVWTCYPMFGDPGSLASTIAAIFLLVLIGIVLILVCVSMVALIRFVYSTERRMDRFSVNGGERSREQTIQVTQQGILYILAYIVVVVPMFIDVVYINFVSGGEFSRVSLPNSYYVFYACIFPLQGLLNAFIYFNPKFKAVRKRERMSVRHSIVRVLDISAPSFRRSPSPVEDQNIEVPEEVPASHRV